jgi:hypothetical protein
MPYDGTLSEDFGVKFPNGKLIYGSLTGAGAGMYGIQLSSAQLLALQSTAVTVVPAASIGGSGWQIYPTSIYAEYVYNSTAYTIGNADNAFSLEYVGKATSVGKMLCTGLVDQAATTLCGGSASILVGPNIAKTNVVNLGLEMKLTGTTPALTLGNGVVNFMIGYDLVTVV